MSEDVRWEGIGGSEIAAILGCDETRDAFGLWWKKKGGKPAEPTGEEPPLWLVIGKKLEPGILDLYTHFTKRQLIYCADTPRFDARRPWMRGTPDALCQEGARGVDAKFASWHQAHLWGPTVDEIPERVYLQAVWYMALMDFEVWDIALLVEGAFRIYTVLRDRDVEERVIATVEAWYQRYLVGDERPPLGRSPAAKEWLRHRYPVHKRPDLRTATAEEARLLDDYVAIRGALCGLTEQREAMEFQLEEAIGEREGLEWPDGKFTWRKTKDGRTTDWESMAIGLMNVHLTDPLAQDELRAFYTRVKPGYRKLRLDSKSLREDNAAEAA